MKRIFQYPILGFLILALCVPLLAQNNNVAQRPFGQQTVAFSATPTFDASKSQGFKMTLTGNVTSSTLTGLEAGMTITLDIYQDSGGSHTFVAPTQVTGFVAILSAANSQTTEICYYDGTNCNVYTTTTSGGGGSGTVNSGTAGHYGYYGASGTTISSNPRLDDGVSNTNGLTYTGTAGIFTSTYNATGSGSMSLIGKESTCSGAAATFDVICIGDLTSHSVEISLNGGSFFPTPQWNSTSPVIHGIVVAETFPQQTAISRGTQGQPFLEGSGSGDPGFGQLDLSISTNVINRLVKANQTTSTVYNDQVNTFTAAGTLDLSASTVASAFRLPNGAGITTAINGACAFETTSNNLHCGVNSADARLPIWTGTAPVHHNCVWWTNVSSHIEIGDAGTTCGGGSTPRLDQVLSATSAWTTTNGDNPLSLQFAQTTAGRTSVELTESAASTSTGTPFLLNVHTLASSTANPANFCAVGTSNCWRIDTTSLLKPIGSATMAIPGTTHGVVVSEGATTATTALGTGTAGQVLISNGNADPSFQDPIISQAYVNLWTAQDVTVTRTSAAVRNPVFSQTGTLQFTWASIAGSPATCTIQIDGVDSQGNVLVNGSTFSVSPANGTTSQTFTAIPGLQTAAQVKAIFACVTYPTAGTLTLDFTPIPNVNVTNSAPLPVGASTSAKQPALGTAGAASSDVITVQGIASMTKLLVTPDSVALPAHQSTNVDQLNGTTTDTNSGNKSAGTLRVVLATDQPQLTNRLLVTPDSVALPANQSVNVSQFNGVTPLMGNGTSGTGAQRVAVASDNTPFETIPVTTATTTDASSTCYLTSAASTNSTNCKGSAGNVYGIYVLNTTTTNYFLRMYNSSAAPTCSSATGFIETIPALGASANGGGISRMQVAQGYGTGIGFCLTGGGSSTDNTNAATGVYITILYK